MIQHCRVTTRTLNLQKNATSLSISLELNVEQQQPCHQTQTVDSGSPEHKQIIWNPELQTPRGAEDEGQKIKKLTTCLSIKNVASKLETDYPASPLKTTRDCTKEFSQNDSWRSLVQVSIPFTLLSNEVLIMYKNYWHRLASVDPMKQILRNCNSMLFHNIKQNMFYLFGPWLSSAFTGLIFPKYGLLSLQTKTS